MKSKNIYVANLHVGLHNSKKMTMHLVSGKPSTTVPVSLCRWL
jgi:hypothetical protein